MLLKVPWKLIGCLAEGIFVVGGYEGHEIHGGYGNFSGAIIQLCYIQNFYHITQMKMSWRFIFLTRP